MTSAEARNILKPPLVFGDDRQIRAHEFLIKVEEAKEAVRACRRNDHRVSRADKWAIARCDCVCEFADDVRIAAGEEYVRESSDQ